MNSKDVVIKIQKINKVYRIGLQEDVHDNIVSAVIDFVKNPIKNYRRYRSLYNFADLKSDDDSPDIIWALKDVSFEIARGEVLGIIGRNGAGKSTLLKILSRITDPTSGRAEINGKVSSLLEVGTGFHPELTGRENVYLNGTILGMSKKEVDQKFDEIVEFSGIEKFIDTPIKRYSSGMKVRLAFSVAAHLQPEILIIDEVLAVGDAEFQKKCLNKMEEVGEEGRTVLFVSHNMHAISRLCHRTILLEEGRILRDGNSTEVISQYLTSDLGTQAAREWSDRKSAPAGPDVRLRAVRVLNADDQIFHSVDIRQAFAIEMQYEVLTSGVILLPHFVLLNEQGLTAFATVDQDLTWRDRPRPAGAYRSRAWIPGNLLAEGLMFVHCNCLSTQPYEMQFRVRNAVSFYVVDTQDGDSARGSYTNKMPGVVRPLLKWTTEFEPHNVSDLSESQASG
jgi:lipopolysaccharide transport system ATP-binding protein